MGNIHAPSTLCEVSISDPEGITYSVEVVASSPFEAAAMALVRFRRAGLSEAILVPATRLRIRGMAGSGSRIGHGCMGERVACNQWEESARANAQGTDASAGLAL